MSILMYLFLLSSVFSFGLYFISLFGCLEFVIDCPFFIYVVLSLFLSLIICVYFGRDFLRSFVL